MFVDKNGVNMEKKLVKQQLLTGERALFASKDLHIEDSIFDDGESPLKERHAGNSFSGKVKAFFMKLAGFPLHSKWTSEEYLRFLRQNGWAVRKSAVLKASFPLTYAECVKSEV